MLMARVMSPVIPMGRLETIMSKMIWTEMFFNLQMNCSDQRVPAEDLLVEGGV